MCYRKFCWIFLIFQKSINIQTCIKSDFVVTMANRRECCKIDAVVTMDSKGQLVLPKDLRERAKLSPNDKLALIGFERDGDICCIVMVKAETLGGTVKNMLEPIFKGALT
jgi:antitoxin PrlF